ncbi:hypothetical protein GALL_452130 [mine drainage metagenome]|uniref:Uncharacterized protein n=1 Tax=mine drainage metagenome TaxID=410659 RepID=A0A1J5PNJ7_9ZZZZ
MHTVNQAIKHVGKVELTVDQLVAHASPTGLPCRDDLDAVFPVQAQFGGHHHTGAVSQRKKADLHLGFFRSVAATCIDSGTQGWGHAHDSHSRPWLGRATGAGMENIGHGSFPQGFKDKKRHPHVATRIKNAVSASGDAFVRCARHYPPLDSARQMTISGLAKYQAMTVPTQSGTDLVTLECLLCYA